MIINPKDNEMLATVMGCFQKAPYRGKIQLGAAWWFLDQKDGMRKQIEAFPCYPKNSAMKYAPSVRTRKNSASAS